MDEKFFTVKLELTARDATQVNGWLEQIPEAMGEAIYHENIIDHDEKHFEARIRYDENWCERGEHFIIENRWSDSETWGLDTAFPLIDYKDEKGVLLHYTALTKIRELMELGIPFRFKGGPQYSHE